jgi:DNA polymerase-4
MLKGCILSEYSFRISSSTLKAVSLSPTSKGVVVEFPIPLTFEILPQRFTVDPSIPLAKSIPAKRFRIKTGETLWQARQKCPGLVVLQPNYYLYMQCSSALLEILKEYSDRIQPFSIDEFFLDFTGMERVLGDPLTVANKIRERVKKDLGFTVNIGISSNKLLAKMAGELKKPDMVHTLFPEEISSKLWPLPVEDLFLVGRATAPKLHRLGIYTIGDLARSDIEILKYKLKSWGVTLWNFANGIEGSTVNLCGRISNVKGIGNSTTTPFDVGDRETAFKVLLSLVETVAMRLRHGGFCCRVVSLSIKTKDFYSFSHQRKLAVPIDCTNAIFKEVKRLFDEMWKGEPIRHLGVRVSDLYINDFIQLSLFEENWSKQLKIDRAIDDIRLKYGPRSVIRSTFLWSGINPLQGGVVEDFPVMSSIL